MRVSGYIPASVRRKALVNYCVVAKNTATVQKVRNNYGLLILQLVAWHNQKINIIELKIFTCLQIFFIEFYEAYEIWVIIVSIFVTDNVFDEFCKTL